MADLTPGLNDLLKPHNVQTLQDTYYSTDQINDFLKEAYQLNARTTALLSYLRQIRRPYLSTAPPPRRRLQSTSQADAHLTDNDRDAIEATTKSLLRDLHAGVTQLKSAESIRQHTDAAVTSKRRWRSGGGILGAWAAGGSLGEKSAAELAEEAKAETAKVHREGVLWFLERGLEEAGLFQAQMVEVRVRRELERGKSVLYKTRGGAPVPVWETDDADDASAGPTGQSAGIPAQELERERARAQGSAGGIDAQQLEQLTRENEGMLRHYSDKLDAVRVAERSMLEISELQGTLSANLSAQGAQIDQLVSDSLYTEENVGTGNKELRKASERKSTAKAVFWATIGVCSVMVVWDAVI